MRLRRIRSAYHVVTDKISIMRKKVVNPDETGFSFLELMITLAIGAILLGLALPSLQSWHGDSEIVASTNDFVTSLHTARSAAVTRGIKVGMCPSSTPTAAKAVCTTGISWTKGWIVFADENGNGVREDPADELLLQMEKRSGGFTITADTVFTDLIYFSLNGTSITQTSIPVSGKVTVKYGNSEDREITLSANGNVSTKIP